MKAKNYITEWFLGEPPFWHLNENEVEKILKKWREITGITDELALAALFLNFVDAVQSITKEQADELMRFYFPEEMYIRDLEAESNNIHISEIEADIYI